MSNIPELRFKEFSGEWKKTFLKDVATKKTHKNKDNTISEVFTNSATEGIVTQRDYFDKDIANQDNLINYYIVNKDDFVYNPRISQHAPVGPLHRNHLGTGVMSPLYTVFTIENEEINLDFIEKYFHTKKWHQYMYSVANYGARSDRMNITTNDLFNMPIIVPQKAEQQKISVSLNVIDKKIRLLTKKLKLQEKYKKEIIQQIFSQKVTFRKDNGGDFPEWQQYSLIEIAKFRRGSFPQPYGNAEWYDNDNGKPFVQVYDVDDNMRLKPKTKNKISSLAQPASVFAKKGTIILTIQGSIGRIALTQYDAFIDRTLLIFTEYLKPINKVFFLYIIYLLFEMEKRKAPGGTIKTITKEALSSFNILLPSLEEQNKIADFLSTLDKQINFTKAQLAKTKEFKTALLQKMFI